MYFNTVKRFRETLLSGQAQVAQKSCITKNIYSIQWIQNNLCFSG